MISARAGLHVSAVALLATAVGLTVFMVTLAAYGQGAAASQPASQPAIAVKSAWLVANWPALAGLLGWLLANVATALSEYPQAKDATTGLAKAIRFIRLFGAALGMVHFKNSGGAGLTLKVPVVPVPETKLNPPEAPKG